MPERRDCTAFLAILFVVMGACWAQGIIHAAVRVYGGAGATVFHGAGVPDEGTSTGFGAGLGVDFASRLFAPGVRADFSYLGAGETQWVQIYLVHLRLFLAKETSPWRPYAEVGLGGGVAQFLGSPGYSASAGGGLLYQPREGMGYFVDVRKISLGHMEASGPTMLTIRAGIVP